MRYKHRRWLIAATLIVGTTLLQAEFVKNSSKHPQTGEERSVIAPRMDYEQWTPIGRGDPLKMDPTYDYVPPVLDRVHYWIDPQSRRPDPPPSPDILGKTEILLLGVSSKKPAAADSRRDSYDTSYVKRKYHQQNHYQKERIYYPQNFKFKNERFTQKPPYHHFVPYTVLMPPPQQPKISSSPSPPSPPVTIQQSNLIYHSSTNEQLIPDANQNDTYHTADSMVDTVTWTHPVVFPENSNSPSTIYKIGKVENVQLGNSYVNIRKPEVYLQSEVSFFPTSPTTTTTTTMTPLPLSVNPIFLHHKQPTELPRLPMHLIIQGHSKVKTYGPTKQVYGINVREFNEIPSMDERYKEFPVKHLHSYKMKEEYMPPQRAGARQQLSNLAEIAQTGYGAPHDVVDKADATTKSDV